MIWWINHASRANLERELVALLDEKSSWLTNVLWSMENGQLVVSFDISFKDDLFELKMVYPTVFPETPPLVYTRNDVRISGHQYGATGELCLEFRSENWDTSITGSNMIESAYRLISGERSSDGEIREIRDGHNVSLGQQTRAEKLRFLVNGKLSECLASLSPYHPYSIEIKSRGIQRIFSSQVESVRDGDTLLWKNDEIVKNQTWSEKGVYIYDPKAKIDITADIEELEILLTQIGWEGRFQEDISNRDIVYLLVGNGHELTLRWFYVKEESIVGLNYKTLYFPEKKQRLPVIFDGLNQKTIGIVGCGSVGSKVAVCFVRSGVQKLLLVDDDILWPGNLVRNELDGVTVGYHKADSLKERIEKINPLAEVNIRKVAFGGQESSATTESVYEQLSKCDAIFDATASVDVFNLCASISRRHKIPIVWCSVFAGGIGGVIARARPDIDPIPQLARRQINNWYKQQNTEWAFGDSNEDYSALDDGTPIIAGDADVSIISYHAANLLIDSLINHENYKFPHSAYIIGLSSEWIFSEPFDTRPITLIPEGEWGDNENDIDEKEVLKLLKAISETTDNAS